MLSPRGESAVTLFSLLFLPFALVVAFVVIGKDGRVVSDT